jgi:[glutamine synthetase] adenylyltransferase / [glutamine synthetase]-adenylyl-L-tyrosine phosphorylase
MRADEKERAESAGSSFSESAFCELGSAARYAKVMALLPAKAASELPGYLATSCNPDRAVLQLEVLLQRHPAEALTAFVSSSLALRASVELFACSPWLGQTLLQNPDLLRLFARPLGLAAERLAEDFREQFARFRMLYHDTPLPVLLARFKRREYVRIFTRELLGLASLPEITGEISALSDVMIEQALSHCESELRSRYQGWPQLRSGQGRVYGASFAVLSLGKLGGNELNYSSDIDLLYLYDDAEDAGAIAIPAREFFIRLAQELTNVLSTVSADGPVFRVDLRLRPQGKSGEMVVGCSQALRYYRGVAEDWELQALLKLRASAGDATLAREFVEQVQELIYCRELSLSAIRTAAQSLERIQRGGMRQGTGWLDVKNGPGGLREIEFAVQCLQRVHGGVEPWLRSSGTLFALQKLHDKGHIGDAEFRELGSTYGLLRAIEHRLQCSQGAQAHRLPESAREQAALFGSMGDGVVGGVPALRLAMESSSRLCARVLRLGSVEEPGEISALSLSLGEPGAERLARELAGRSEKLAGVLAAGVGDATLRGLRRFLAAASTGEHRIREALVNAGWIADALPVFAQSALGSGILACHPEDIVALFRRCESDGAKAVADRLRIEARRCTLRLVGRTLLEEKPVWEILREYSRSFDRILSEALGAAEPPEGFAVFATGRLGTCELDALSDADLVFLRSAECDAERADRCALSVVAMLSGYTHEGSVIDVDTRLRPHGSDGELVASVRQLGQYFESEAEAWEALAFGKLRWVAGDERLASAAAERLTGLRERFACAREFVPGLRAMRQRIADSGGAESFKTGQGGLYDLDFILGMLEVRAGLPAAGLQLAERLAALRERGLLTGEQAGSLLHSAGLFRRVEHAVRVVEGRARKWVPESDALRQAVEKLVGRGALDGGLRAEMGAVRTLFDAILVD